ncbi:MAG TPA: DUF2934 domain-containing protein [Bryobacteraceae bacterium]|nr:DUF2934 domain-containing protein [Bryobacteraceae bacterium]
MTKKTTAEKAVSAVKKPRAVKPASPRVTSVRHSKAAATTEPPTSADPVVPFEAAVPVKSFEAISKIAYGYWESRGCQGGNPTEDWLRAEAEYRATL